MNGYRIHIYEKEGKGWVGHADHPNGRKVHVEDEPDSLGNILERTKTAIVADALRQISDDVTVN